MSPVPNKQRHRRAQVDPQPRTFCRILCTEKGPDGTEYVMLEPITDPQERHAAQKRCKATLRKLFATTREGGKP